MRANYLGEQYESGEIIPVYCPGVEQAADLLTKALPSARILELAAIWGLLEHGTSRPAQAQACSEARTVAVAQQDLQLSTLAVLLALFQVVGASSQSTDEDEDLSLFVSLDADLMLAVSIICIGVCCIAVWEFLKWCFSSVIVRREAGTAVSSLSPSPRKARKLQRLRDQTAQAIQAEISAREEAASSQSVAAASKRRPSQTTNAGREQAGGAPTCYFATPEGTKLHRTKTCSTLANSHRFVEYQVCQAVPQEHC